MKESTFLNILTGKIGISLAGATSESPENINYGEYKCNRVIDSIPFNHRRVENKSNRIQYCNCKNSTGSESCIFSLHGVYLFVIKEDTNFHLFKGRKVFGFASKLLNIIYRNKHSSYAIGLFFWKLRDIRFAIVENDNSVHAVFRRCHFHKYHFCFDEALRVSLFDLLGSKNLPWALVIV